MREAELHMAGDCDSLTCRFCEDEYLEGCRYGNQHFFIPRGLEGFRCEYCGQERDRYGRPDPLDQ